jgi:hypothetical protein
VSFALNSTVGGLSLSPASQTSASDGTVQTVVSSGTVHTVVRVTASIASPALSTQSSQLTVTTGLPAAAAFSIAVGAASYGSATSTLACPNVDAFNLDGVTVPVTVRLADRYNNPVPDGTAVAFNTNGGHIDGSCTTPLASPGDGTCKVTWTSANPRPAVNSDTPPLLAAGRATILATTIGEESFTDVNGNGYWDSGEPFVALGEPYRDDNENGDYDLGEYFLDFNHNGVRDAASTSPTGFIGITCTGNPLSCSTQTLAISASHLIIMSTGAGVLTLPNGSASSSFTVSGSPANPTLTIAHTASGTFKVNLADGNGNSMAAGTTVTMTLDNAAIGTVTQTPGTFVVPCSSDLGGVDTQGSFVASATPGSGNIAVTATSPGGTVTIFYIHVTVT